MTETPSYNTVLSGLFNSRILLSVFKSLSHSYSTFRSAVTVAFMKSMFYSFPAQCLVHRIFAMNLVDGIPEPSI